MFCIFLRRIFYKGFHQKNIPTKKTPKMNKKSFIPTQWETPYFVSLYTVGGFVIEMKILKKDYRMNMPTKLSSNLSSAILFYKRG
jgi:hypothetical protein